MQASEATQVSQRPTDLRGFLETARQAGLLDVVTEPVLPRFQLARRLHERPDRVLLFRNVVGCTTGAVGGVIGRRDLLALALGTTTEGLVPHIARGLAGRDSPLVEGASPRFEAHTVERPDLGKELPRVVFYPQGERAYLTAGIIAARSARYGMNYSFHRMMFLGGNRLVVRVVPRHLKMILDEGGGQGRVAVLLGVHPALSVAAASSGPPDMDELCLAGRLLGQAMPVCEVDGLRVPAQTEILLVGRFTGELADEGPFVDITGTLDGVRRQPVLEIEALHRQKDAICPVILPGGLEHRILMGLPQEPRLWNAVQAAVPGLRRLVLTPGGSCWLHAVVSISSRTPGEGKNAGLAALAGHPSLKRVVVVDEDIDPGNPEEVEWAIATRCQPDRDLVVIPGARGSSLDPSRDPALETTAKWIIDATRPPWAEPEALARVAPPEEDEAGTGSGEKGEGTPPGAS